VVFRVSFCDLRVSLNMNAGSLFLLAKVQCKNSRETGRVEQIFFRYFGGNEANPS
jgi:hypothetical protein